jgi:hypothetical protein
MNVPNQLLSIKVRDFALLNRQTSSQRIPVRRRRGFYSYIHNYQRHSSRAFGLFTAIAERLRGKVEVRNFAVGARRGRLSISPRCSARGRHSTLRMRCCNAVIDSISVGIPVLVDDETLDRLGPEDYVVHMVSGIRFRDANEGEEWIRILDRDDRPSGRTEPPDARVRTAQVPQHHKRRGALQAIRPAHALIGNQIPLQQQPAARRVTMGGESL